MSSPNEKPSAMAPVESKGSEGSRPRFKRAFKWGLASFAALFSTLMLIAITNPLNIRNEVAARILVDLRLAPERLDNPKSPSDYGMSFSDIDIFTADNIRLSGWEIPAPISSDKTIIMNHPLLTTRYGSVEGLDGVSAEFLPMVKHLHDSGYNVVMYDHRGHGESDGGLGASAIGTETPIGVGVLEWQDVVASLKYVLSHQEFSNDQIIFLSQCMGANATFLAWQKEPELFANPQIKGLIANQPTLSYEFSDRYIRANAFGLDLVDDVLRVQLEKYGFGFTETLNYVPSLTVPVLYAQVEKDVYTFDVERGKNDIQRILDATPTEHDIVWIGSNQEISFGSDKRFDAYQYFNFYPERLLEFLEKVTI